MAMPMGLQVNLKMPEPTHFPPEILLVILRGALPPVWVLHGDLTSTSRDSFHHCDIRMKLSFVNVCKSWHDVGMELLYETVILYRIGQLPTLVRALEGREGLGSLVKHLDITFFTPRGYTALLESDTRRLFELCPRLSRFGFAPAYLNPGLTHVLPPLASTITCLDYGDIVQMSMILPSLVQLHRTIRSLSLTVTTTPYDGPQLNFDSLEDLHLRLAQDHTFPEEKWAMPSLRRLWLRSVIKWAAPWGVGRLLGVYGSTLTFLEWDQGTRDLKAMLESCPELQHLVLTFHSWNVGSISIGHLSHKKIETIDIWRTWPTFDRRPIFDHLGGFTALRSIRDLDSTYKCFWDLPVRVPPDPRHDDASRKLGSFSPGEYPDIMDDVREFSAHKFVHGPLVALGDRTDDYVFNDDGDLTSLHEDGIESSSDSDSNSSSVSSSYSHELEDEFYMADDWQISHEEALRVLSTIP
ncbi:hypothetical protein C8F04DRAFT_455626 [Mycena alexandri]|uniref:F-box domain-containing protein n=1 Tax=Mycena alexandri TaxID=1745969 RepID=A0AAD6XFC7_9AGAR|nr:hypothetical protein C8F04DRAFT_455626 [Mycena alexandri]